MDYSQDCIMYLLRHMETTIEQSVYSVLNDSESDPQFSAVTTANLINCYICVMQNMQIELPYHDVFSFFQCNMISEQDYEVFIKKYNCEKTYYVGKIFGMEL